MWSRYRPGAAQRVGRGVALLFHDHGTRRGWVVSSTPRPNLKPLGKTQYTFYRRLGGPQGWSGWAENLVPTGIRSRTVQPVVSRYTNWATRPTSKCNNHLQIDITEMIIMTVNIRHTWRAFVKGVALAVEVDTLASLHKKNFQPGHIFRPTGFTSWLLITALSSHLTTYFGSEMAS